MIIAIDYDDTYTRDPILWNNFIRESIGRGHDVWCVTARYPHTIDDVENTIGYVIGHDHIISTSNEPKKSFVFDNFNLLPDVWIDDTPEAIVSWN